MERRGVRSNIALVLGLMSQPTVFSCMVFPARVAHIRIAGALLELSPIIFLDSIGVDDAYDLRYCRGLHDDNLIAIHNYHSSR